MDCKVDSNDICEAEQETDEEIVLDESDENIKISCEENKPGN